METVIKFYARFPVAGNMFFESFYLKYAKHPYGLPFCSIFASFGHKSQFSSDFRHHSKVQVGQVALLRVPGGRCKGAARENVDGIGQTIDPTG